MENWSVTPFSVLQGLISVFTLILALIMWQRRGVPGSRSLTFMLLAVTIWASMTGLDAASVPLSQKILWSKIQYLGISTCPAFYLLFTLEYTNQEHFLTRARLVLLWAIPVLTLALAVTNQFHQLIWNSFIPVPGTNLIIYGYGPWFWVFVIYAYVMVVMSMILLIRALIRYPAFYRQQAFMLLVATFFPWLGNFVYISRLAPGLDLTPTGFAITGVLLTWAIYRQGLLDLVPVARERVLEWMQDGLVVLDDQRRIVDLNLAAEQVLSQVSEPRKNLPGRWVGQEFSAVVAAWAGLLPLIPFEKDSRHEIFLDTARGRQYFDLRVSLISGQPGRRTGVLILLHDITHLKNIQQEAQRAREVAEVLYATSGALSSSSNFTDSLILVLDQINQVIACDGGAFALGEHPALELSVLRGLSPSDGQQPQVFQIPVSANLSAGELQSVQDAVAAGVRSLDNRISACITAPIIYQGALTGVLLLFRRSSLAFSPEEGRIAANLAAQVAIAQANTRMLAQVRSMAATDSLTALNNRGHFFTLAHNLFDHSLRYNEAFSLIMFDLDHFKQINDRFGHLAGDEVLRVMSNLCHNLIRKVDVFARYGGEEFVIALPTATMAQTVVIADRLRQEVERTAFTYRDQSIHITLSLGVASYADPQDTLESVLERADQALYLAKQAGRNCVQTNPPTP